MTDKATELELFKNGVSEIFDRLDRLERLVMADFAAKNDIVKQLLKMIRKEQSKKGFKDYWEESDG